MTDECDFTRRRGDDYPIVLTVPFDATGGTFLLTVDPSRNPTSAANNLFQLTGSITSASASESEIEFTLTSVQADNLGRYYYDVEMTLSGVVYTTTVGSITFTQDITK